MEQEQWMSSWSFKGPVITVLVCLIILILLLGYLALRAVSRLGDERRERETGRRHSNTSRDEMDPT